MIARSKGSTGPGGKGGGWRNIGTSTRIATTTAAVAVNQNMLLGEKDGEIVSANTNYSYWYGYRQSGKRSLFYVITDRPIYRPNQTVQFKIIHREEEGVKLHVREGLKVKVWITDQKNNKLYEKDHVLGRFGSTDGSFTLGDEPSLGTYRVHVQIDGKQPQPDYYYWYGYGFPNSGQFRVDE